VAAPAGMLIHLGKSHFLEAMTSEDATHRKHKSGHCVNSSAGESSPARLCCQCLLGKVKSTHPRLGLFCTGMHDSGSAKVGQIKDLVHLNFVAENEDNGHSNCGLQRLN
jgi:hypothetical protein